MGKKVKIAFLSFYSGEVYRGVETFVHELGNRLQNSGYEVVVYQNGPKISGSIYRTVSTGLEVDWTKKNGKVSPPHIPFTDYWGFLLKRFTSFVLKAIDKDVDIIIPTNGGWQVLFCKIWALRYGKKIVVTGHSGIGFDDRWNLWCFPNRFVAISTFAQNWANRANPFVKSVTIHNGIDLNQFGKKVKPVKIDLRGSIVLNVGALIPNKRQDLIIEAVSRLENVSLLLIGKGENERKLTDLGNRLLPNRFKIMNFSYDQMPSVYASADLFSYPTVSWESFGLVLLEAMASGLPVVASDDPIRREIVGDAGIFVDPTDIKKYADAIEKALKTKWGDKPHKQAEKFSWDDIAKKYMELFDKITS